MPSAAKPPNAIIGRLLVAADTTSPSAQAGEVAAIVSGAPKTIFLLGAGILLVFYFVLRPAKYLRRTGKLCQRKVQNGLEQNMGMGHSTHWSPAHFDRTHLGTPRSFVLAKPSELHRRPSAFLTP